MAAPSEGFWQRRGTLGLYELCTRGGATASRSCSAYPSLFSRSFCIFYICGGTSHAHFRICTAPGACHARYTVPLPASAVSHPDPRIVVVTSISARKKCWGGGRSHGQISPKLWTSCMTAEPGLWGSTSLLASQINLPPPSERCGRTRSTQE